MPAITFLMGSDPANAANAFYANAKGFFSDLGSEVIDAPAGGQSLETAFKVLRDKAAENPPKIYDPINVVSHASGFSSFEFKLRTATADPFTSEDDLTAEIVKINAKAADAWKQLGPPIIVSTTKVVLYGCDVGRGAPFVENFGRLFGEDLHVYAPLRVAVFRHVGAKYEHRLARTWSVPWPSSITDSTNWSTPQKATATRQAFLAAADQKFGARWILVKSVVGPTLLQELTPIANAATPAMGASWFFGEQVSLDVTDPANPQADIALMIPSKSAIIAPGGTDVDDTTVQNVIGPAQVTHKIGPKTWAAEIAVLAQIIEQAVSITDASQYRHVDIDPPKAPSPGPKPPPNTPPVVPPAHSNLWEQARDELIAAGVGAAELDAVAAELAPADDEAMALPDSDTPAIDGLDRDPTAEDFA